ncbi:MAG: cbb3-type cytochrome oxidase assembly protein CcoS [Burkholderiales bacterium]|jgi:cbb3-type cytochrome oxidase maturation protein|nr:cbb3-type cytochrome oxidase assembly protein CcoS [Burkholderiales bacterium]
MESLWLLIPLSVGVALAIVGVFAWALFGGQFDELDAEGTRILDPVDADQPAPGSPPEQSSRMDTPAGTGR